MCPHTLVSWAVSVHSNPDLLIIHPNPDINYNTESVTNLKI